jgi:predicted transposase/invertase (TIGR01784 family)
MKSQKEQQPKELYQNIVTDYGFKTVFTKKHFLISFLNELLQGQEKIASIEYINPHHLGKSSKERGAIFDVYCRNDKGELILLEMQNYYQKYFNHRAVYYSSHLIQEQGVKGEWEFYLKPMYIIGILNFTDKNSRDVDAPVRHAQILYTDNHKPFFENLNFISVNLSKFTKSSDKLETPLDYWLHVLTHSQPNRQINEKLLRSDKLFAELLDTIDLRKLNKSEMRKYKASKLTFEDMRPYMSGHYEEGLEKGIQQTAFNALKKGFSLEDISEITNLPISELEKMKSQL